MKTKLLCSLLIGLSCSIAAQSLHSASGTTGISSAPEIATGIRQEAYAKPGTYQFIISNRAKDEAFTKDVLILIESKRDQTKEVMLTLSPSTSIRIPSRTEINRREFIPLAETVYLKK